MLTNQEIAEKLARKFKFELTDGGFPYFCENILSAITEATEQQAERINGYKATLDRFEKRIDELREYIEQLADINGSPKYLDGHATALKAVNERINYLFISPAKADSENKQAKRITELQAALKRNASRAEEVHDLDMVEIKRLKERIEDYEAAEKRHLERFVEIRTERNLFKQLVRDLAQSRLDVPGLEKFLQGHGISFPPTENRPDEESEADHVD